MRGEHDGWLDGDRDGDRICLHAERRGRRIGRLAARLYRRHRLGARRSVMECGEQARRGRERGAVHQLRARDGIRNPDCAGTSFPADRIHRRGAGDRRAHCEQSRRPARRRVRTSTIDENGPARTTCTWRGGKATGLRVVSE